MCDSLCVLLDDRVRFAKSSDRPEGEVQLIEAFDRRTAGGTLRTQYLEVLDHGAAAFLAGRPSWLWGVEQGVNEHRVAIGNERIWTKDDPASLPPALTGMDLVRLGLERARTAAGAVDVITALIEELGQGGIGEEATGEAYFSSFLVADPAEAWIVETSARTWVARRVKGHDRGASISNRVTIGTDWARASADVAPGASFQRWRDLDYPTPHADRRIAATSAVACAEPPPGPAELAAVLRHHGRHPWGAPGAAPTATGTAAGGTDAIDPLPVPRVDRHGNGVSVCMHLRGWEATTGSLIAELPRDPDEPARAWTLMGNPCVGVFVPAFVPGPVPATLADLRTWQRFEVLKTWVERARDAAAAAADEPGPRARKPPPAHVLAAGDGPAWAAPDAAGPAGEAALAEVRSVLDPVEADLWAEADEAAADPARRDALLASVGPRLDAALVELGVP